MIDKQQVNDFFQCFEKELIIEVIDLACEQIPESIEAIAQNIDNHNFAQLRWNANKIKGVVQQLYDRESYDQARKLVHAARRNIDEIINISLHEFPETLDKLKKKFPDHNSWITVNNSLNHFLTGLIGPLSDEDALKLEELENRTMADGIPQMFSELKISSASLMEELLVMKQELTSG